MQNHILKCREPFWSDVAAGKKRFELRWDDRGYAVGDTLELHRVGQPGNLYPPLMMHVTRILTHADLGDGPEATLLTPGVVIMSIEPITTAKDPAAAMVRHLTETLKTIRELLDVEICNDKNRQMVAYMIGEIDEALS